MLLRILSKDPAGTLESSIIILEHVQKIGFIKEETPVEQEEIIDDSADLEVRETKNTTESEDEKEPEVELRASELTIVRTDGTSEEFNLTEKEYNFEIRDPDGDIICQTNDIVELEEAVMVVLIPNSHDRGKKLKDFRAHYYPAPEKK